MILHYELEVDDATGPQVIGLMIERFGKMSRFITQNPLSADAIRDCICSDTSYLSDNPISNTNYSHLKIIRRAV
jgi:hypothetical protein